MVQDSSRTFSQWPRIGVQCATLRDKNTEPCPNKTQVDRLDTCGTVDAERASGNQDWVDSFIRFCRARGQIRPAIWIFCLKKFYKNMIFYSMTLYKSTLCTLRTFVFLPCIYATRLFTMYVLNFLGTELYNVHACTFNLYVAGPQLYIYLYLQNKRWACEITAMVHAQEKLHKLTQTQWQGLLPS